MDRIDIHMQVPRVEFQKLRDMRPGESSEAVSARLEATQEGLRARFEGTVIDSNANRMNPSINYFLSLEMSQ